MAIIKIDKEAFRFNLQAIIDKTKDIEKIAIVLKDNAYGHGLSLMANLSSSLGISHAVVKNIDEAKEIREFFDTILILGGDIVCDDKYSFAINSLDDIENAQPKSRVELKIDTGMGRNGILVKDIDKALELIDKRDLKLIGVMTHFRSSDTLSSEFFWQQNRFELIKSKIKNLGYKNIRYHSHNSSAILRNKNFDEDLVRVGLALYGYNELEKSFDDVKLKPILSLSASKISNRDIKKGDRLGYGGDFIAPKDMNVSTYNIGYGDGWHRAFKSTQYNEILGRVSMDFIILNRDDDEVCIFDNAKVLADRFGTISYEVFTSLSKDIERVVI